MVLIHTLQHPSRIHDVKFCKGVEGDGELLLVGAEDKKVSIYDVPTDREKALSIIAYLIGHENRCVYLLMTGIHGLTCSVYAA